MLPGVIGAVDCTHVPIQSPGGQDEEIYRKCLFSLSTQGWIRPPQPFRRLLVASRNAVSFLIFDNVNPRHHNVSKQLSLTGSGVSRPLIMTVCHCSLQHSQRYDKFSIRSKTAKFIARYKTKKLTKQSNKHQKVLKPTLKSVKNPKNRNVSVVDWPKRRQW